MSGGMDIDWAGLGGRTPERALDDADAATESLRKLGIDPNTGKTLAEKETP